MTRWWTELVAGLADLTWGGVAGLGLALVLGATLVALLWYYWPLRLPWLGRRGGRGKPAKGARARFRWPRWTALRWRWPRLRWLWSWWPWRRRRRQVQLALDRLADDELPDLPAEVLALTADQLAAAGRYAEAVRERLRAIVRAMVEREVIEPRPGWTVTELAAAAARARPATASGLRAAADIFSDIWYGQRPATVDDDTSMREHASTVHSALDAPVAGPVAGPVTR